MSIQFSLSELESIIKKNSTPQSQERGKEYHEQGYVEQVISRENNLQGKVEGSLGEEYLVNIELSSQGIESATCTCPYDWGGWCKHIIATLYYYQFYPQNIKIRPSLEELLSHLSPLENQKLIILLVKEIPWLMENIEQQINRIAPITNQTKNSGSSYQKSIETKPIRNQVRRLIENGVQALEEGYDESPLEEDLAELIKSVEDLIEQEEIDNALLTLAAITETCIENWDEADNYGIEAYETANLLDEAFSKAILLAKLDSTEKVDLTVDLEFWQNEWSVDFEMSLAALEQGWDYAPLQKKLQGEITYLSEGERLERPNHVNKLALIRLKILAKKNRNQEYLYLAKAEGKIEHYLTYLVHLGNIEEAVKEGKLLIATTQEAWSLAKSLLEEGERQKALEIASLGLTKEGMYKIDLAHWTAELAEEIGNEEITLTALIQAFKTEPSLEDYQKIEKLAQDKWLILKEELLEELGKYEGWYVSREKVKILIEEKLFEEVINLVDSSPYLLNYEVLEAVIPFNPDWVIQKAIPKAESIMDAGKAKHYKTAINWLNPVRQAYYQANKIQQWKTYYQELKQIHGRKRKLMELLKPLA